MNFEGVGLRPQLFVNMDKSCILASILFFVGNLFLVNFSYAEAQSRFSNTFIDEITPELLEETLDAEFIKLRWEFRRDWTSVTVSSSLINALAWLVFTIPMLQLAWILSLGGRRNVGMHAAIVILCLGSTFTEFISLLFNVGMSNVGGRISEDANLQKWLDETNGGTQDVDNIGWRVLELSYTMLSGMIVWVDAFEWLSMFMTLTLIYISWRSLAANGPEDPRSFVWVHLGLFIGILSLVDFASLVLRFEFWKYFTTIAFFCGVINRLILLPLWLCLLAYQIPAIANSVEMSPMPNFLTKMIDGQDNPAPSSLNVEPEQGSNDDLVAIPLEPIT